MKKYLLFTVLWWTLLLDWPFWQKALAYYDGQPDWTFLLILAIVFGLLNLAFLRLLAYLPHRAFQVIMILLTLIGAGAFCGAYLYGVAITPNMMRNVIATDTAEAAGYLSLKTIALFLLVSVVPVIYTVLLKRPVEVAWGWAKGLAIILLSLAVSVGLVMNTFQDMAGFFRGQKDARYFLAPYNVVYSYARTFATDQSPDDVKNRTVLDAHPERLVKPTRPTLFVMVVGETARVANWELSGYARETNPELKKIPQLINFLSTTACGTSTDESVPCLFSPIGRHNYDRDAILQTEPLPAVLQRAGFDVEWIDNQSGCKDACYNVPERKVEKNPTYCPDGTCMDGAFLPELDKALANVKPAESKVLILHMMGSHGPAYYERSPEAVKAFGPECRDAALNNCSREMIEAEFDNSLRYTDWVLAELIKRLEAAKGVDTALLYVSDHGESLGEGGLYLHGAPYFIAPDVQKEVPMVMWFSPEFETDYQVNRSALEAVAKTKDATHDHLYHTIMGLLKVKGDTYDVKYDLQRTRP